MYIKWDKDTEEHMQVMEKEGVVYLAYPAFKKFPQF